jgi:hypothetical protein
LFVGSRRDHSAAQGIELQLGEDGDNPGFLESGRSQPSREMVLRLTERLSVPLRGRNIILNAAGFAPVYRERPLDALELGCARAAIYRLLKGHEPHPALAVDRNWTLLSANKAVGVLMTGVADHLVAGEINVLRLNLHPEGFAGRILNFREMRAIAPEYNRRVRRDGKAKADQWLAKTARRMGRRDGAAARRASGN